MVGVGGGGSGSYCRQCWVGWMSRSWKSRGDVGLTLHKRRGNWRSGRDSDGCDFLLSRVGFADWLKMSTWSYMMEIQYWKILTWYEQDTGIDCRWDGGQSTAGKECSWEVAVPDPQSLSCAGERSSVRACWLVAWIPFFIILEKTLHRAVGLAGAGSNYFSEKLIEPHRA